jgi:hypothetical protein
MPVAVEAHAFEQYIIFAPWPARLVTGTPQCLHCHCRGGIVLLAMRHAMEQYLAVRAVLSAVKDFPQTRQMLVRCTRIFALRQANEQKRLPAANCDGFTAMGVPHVAQGTV